MSRIKNLDDYNDVRIALQNADGNKEKLYKMIGDVAVAKAAPKIHGYWWCCCCGCR